MEKKGVYVPKSHAIGSSITETDEQILKQLEGLSNEEMQKMILELE